MLWHMLNADYGGVAKFVEQLVKSQIERYGHAYEVIRVAGPSRLSFPPSVERDFYSPIRSVWGLNQWRFAVYSWRRVLSASTRDSTIIHAHNFVFVVPDVYTAHMLYTEYSRGQPASSSLSGATGKLFQRYLLARFERRMLETSRRVVFVSQHSRNYAETVLNIRRPNHFSVIAPGVDATVFTPRLRTNLRGNRRAIFPEVEPDCRWLLFVGNDFSGKGLLRILECLAEKPAPDRWAFLIFGRDPKNLKTAETLARKARGGQVHLFSDDSRIVSAFGLSDLLLMNSISEGFGMALIEALASGCVPVVTPSGGVSMLIAHDVNGVVLKDAAEIVQVALTLSDETIGQLSDRAIRTGRSRSWQKVAEEYQDLYIGLER